MEHSYRGHLTSNMLTLPPTTNMLYSPSWPFLRLKNGSEKGARRTRPPSFGHVAEGERCGRNLAGGIDFGLGIRHRERTGSEVESPQCGHYPGLHGRRARSRVRIRFREREYGIRSQRGPTICHDVRDRRSDGLRGAKHVELEGVSHL